MNCNNIRDRLIKAAEGGYEELYLEMIAILKTALLGHLRPPEVFVKSLVIGEGFWKDKSFTSAQLLDARVACWNFVDSFPDPNGIHPDQSLVRALIGCLFEVPETPHIHDEVDFFIEMSDAASVVYKILAVE